MKTLRFSGFAILLLALLTLLMEALLPTSSFAQTRITTNTQRFMAGTSTSDNESGYYAGDGNINFQNIGGNVKVPCLQGGTKGSVLAVMMGAGGVYGGGKNGFYGGFLEKPGGALQPFYSYSQANTPALNPQFISGMGNIACGDTFYILVYHASGGGVGLLMQDTTKGLNNSIDIPYPFTPNWKSVGMFVARNYCPSVGTGGAYSPLAQFSTDVSWSGLTSGSSANASYALAIGELPHTQVMMASSKNSSVTLAQASALSTPGQGSTSATSSFTNHWVSAGPDGNSAC